jgi:hypothetical protein
VTLAELGVTVREKSGGVKALTVSAADVELCNEPNAPVILKVY